MPPPHDPAAAAPRDEAASASASASASAPPPPPLRADKREEVAFLWTMFKLKPIPKSSVFGRAHTTLEVAWNRFWQRRAGIKPLTRDEMLEQYRAALEAHEEQTLLMEREQQRIDAMSNEEYLAYRQAEYIPLGTPKAQIPLIMAQRRQQQRAHEAYYSDEDDEDDEDEGEGEADDEQDDASEQRQVDMTPLPRKPLGRTDTQPPLRTPFQWRAQGQQQQQQQHQQQHQRAPLSLDDSDTASDTDIDD